MSNTNIDITQYPMIEEMVKECGMENDLHQIEWHRLSNTDAAVALVEMSMMCQASLSNNLNLRKRSKIAANYYHTAVGNSVHLMASAQAKADLGITEYRLSQLFSHKEKIFGT